MRPNVLIVDDNQENLLAMRSILSDLEADIIEANSGNDALALLLRQEFAVVLMDVQMPMMDGFETAALMRGSRMTKDTPIIFITGRSKDELQVLKGYDSGGVDYLTKPVDSTILFCKVKVFVELHKQKAELKELSQQLKQTVDELAQSQSQLEQLVRHDQLTGLANRRCFRERIEEAIHRSQRSKDPVAVMLLDLDGFKEVNDTLGHDAGDQLLIEVALRLKDSVRTVDSVARLGGDEFTVILEGMVAADDASIVAARILTVIAEPFELNGKQRNITASIGIGLYPKDSNDIDGLLKCADLAMYQAKQDGKNAYKFHDSIAQSKSDKPRVPMAQLRDALKQQAFRLHYQPQFELSAKRISAIKVLLRWRCGDVLVSPQEFLPELERSRMILAVGEWILDQIGVQLHAWRAQQLPPTTIALNLSTQQVHDYRLVELISKFLQQQELPPNLLQLELTEQPVMDDQKIGSMLDELKKLGVLIALNDFGSSASSLVMIKRLPIDLLKIDGRVVAGLPDDADCCCIASSIIDLAHQFGLKVIAKGIETDQQLAFLREKGCDGGQGFVFCRPIPEEEITHFLQRFYR